MNDNITHNITITVSDQLYEDIKVCAEQMDMTVTQWVLNAIRHTMDDK